MEDPEYEEFCKAIDVLESASKLPARSRATNVSPFVEEIVDYAYQNGLKTPELKRLVKVLAATNELDATSCTTLIKNLFPAEKISSDIVITTIGALGHGSRKPNSNSQANLIRWITAVQDVLEEPNFLSRFYHVLFNCLDLINIRSPVCQLLGVLTRRKHVRPFRVQKLLSLCQQFGNERALIDLLRVYKNFNPDIIISIVPVGRVPLSAFDSEWLGRLRAIQDATRMFSGPPTTTSNFKVSRNEDRSQRHKLIPEVHSFHADEESVTLEEINSAEEFVEKLEKIEPPAQIIATLRDPLLQKYLQLRSSADLERRFDFWLESYLQDELELVRDGFGLSTSLPELLTGLLSYTETKKELPSILEQFLLAYIPIWDGQSNLGLITDLVAFISPRSISEIYPTVLGPLEQAILRGAHNPLESLLDFYAKIAERWIGSFSDESIQNPEERRKLRKHYMDLQIHASTLVLNAVVTSEHSSSAAIDYLDRVCSLTLETLSNDSNAEMPVGFATTHTFYILLMTSSIAALSRLCHILERYYTGKTTMRDQFSRTFLGADATGLNRYLMDTCNLFYRARALDSSISVGAGCLCPQATVQELQFYLPKIEREYSLASMFGFSWHPLISGLAGSAFRDFEESQGASEVISETEVIHQGPVSQRSLLLLADEGGANLSWKEYRKLVLKWLSEHGLDGIEKLLSAAMKLST